MGSVTKFVKMIPETKKIIKTPTIPNPGIYRGCPNWSTQRILLIFKAVSILENIQTIKKMAEPKGKITIAPLIK
jgi:hypothetical protein